MWSRRTCHSQCATLIFQAIVRLILNFALVWLFAHVGIHATALNHEVRDNAVENSAIIKTVLYIGNEVFSRNRCIFSIQFDGDVAFAGFN